MIVRRPTTAQEMDAWALLRRALWPWHTPEELRRDLDAMLADPAAAIFLVWPQDAGELPIAFIELSTRVQAHGSDGQPVPYIEGWYVAPNFKRTGIGATLVHAAEAWAQVRGFDRIASDTIAALYPDSPGAHAALGFRIAAHSAPGVVEDEAVIHFIKELKSEQGL